MTAEEAIMLENTAPSSVAGAPEQAAPEAQPTEQAGKPTSANPTVKSPFIPRARFDDINEKYRDLQSTHSTLSASYQTALSEPGAIGRTLS